MVFFEIKVNGESRFVGDDVRAITLVSDHIERRQRDRVTVHVGVGPAGNRTVDYLGSDLRAGDEISIRLLADEEATAEDDDPKGCSFCGNDIHHIRSLVSGDQAAICRDCVVALEATVTGRAPLPLGASFGQEDGLRCGFCLKARPEVTGFLVRNGAVICAECLHVCADITRQGRAEEES